LTTRNSPVATTAIPEGYAETAIRWLVGNSSARGDGLDQAGRLGRAQGIAVPTFKPDRAEMRRVQATIRGCSNCRSTI
jgi:hypothetical protein